MGKFTKAASPGLLILLVIAVVTTCLRFESCVGPQAEAYQSAYPIAYKYIDGMLAPLCSLISEWDSDTTVALGTLVIAAFTFTLWRSTDKLWKAGERQIGLAEKTLIASQRPWVSFNVGAKSPFIFTKRGAGIDLRITTRNTGPTPAINVFVAAFFLTDEIDIFNYNQVIKDQTLKFTRGEGRWATEFGHALFSGNKFIETIMLSLPSFEFEGRETLMPYVAVITRYNFTFSDSVHHTAKLYMLSRVDPHLPNRTFEITVGVDVPIDEVKIDLRGSYAD
jgi:hypothetical protein